MPNARQRGTGVRIRSEAKAAAADRLLLAAQEAAQDYDIAKLRYEQTPKWRFRRRRRFERGCLIHASRHLTAIRAAQDIAKKGKFVDIG